MAFKIAGSMAIKEALRKSSPVLLEPMMAVEVVTPEEFMGDVIGDLIVQARPYRGHGAARQRAGRSARRCRFPRCSAIRPIFAAKTQGRAVYSMQFKAYEQVPRSVADEIIKKVGGEVRS